MQRVAGSFRDPSGYVFEHDGVLYRAVMERFREDFEAFVDSGCHAALVDAGLLVDHDDLADTSLAPEAWKILRPERVPFLTWPHEWSPGQRRAAAIATLDAQLIALEHDLVLRDASAFNVQFVKGRPILIDTLSFGRRVEDAPWTAYGQFCRHFLAPLALEAHVDPRLAALLLGNIDGIPLDLAAGLLPGKTKRRPGLAMHLHLHARATATREADPDAEPKTARFSRKALVGMAQQLRGAVGKLSWEPRGTVWVDYYDEAGHYDEAAMDAKVALVRRHLESLAPDLVFDLGANTGRFSQLAAGTGATVVAADIDHGAVEGAWRAIQERPLDVGDLIPIRYDLANPTPRIGWGNEERADLADRGPADVILALALVHHLAIGNNVPLTAVLEVFARLGRSAVVEWVPKDDPKVRVLLATREDIFDGYTQEAFEDAAAAHFQIAQRDPVGDSGRILYLLHPA
ncbi:MAG: hypothetical protein R3249_02610 [Nitriliruptorales bacterium]|nr:hypothetical protein [Nitriliruptorales bacterium]